MREWCGCGAAIHGRRRDVLAWRTDHRHGDAPSTSELQVPPTGAASVVQPSWQPAGFRAAEL